MFKRRKKSATPLEDFQTLSIPNHIAIIMDGNGRWAQKRKMPRNLGHKAGVEKVKTITKACSNYGVKYLTLYAFSTENWKRSEQEVSGLMELLVFFLKNELQEMHENNVRICTIGDLSRLPDKPRAAMENAIETTKNNDGIFLTIALNYGSRAEIERAVKSIAMEVEKGHLHAADITEDMIASKLDTSFMPDPDLMIRTSGEIRLSNYLLWQLAYTEFYFCETLWPDFDEKALHEAILTYSKRQRRFGKA